jgi:hypothetical protein
MEFDFGLVGSGEPPLEETVVAVSPPMAPVAEPPSVPHFLRLMAVMDHLAPEDHSLQEALLTSAQKVLTEQGWVVPDRAVADAVKMHLNPAITPHPGPNDEAPCLDFADAWKLNGPGKLKQRPADAAEHQRLLKKFQRWPWRLARWFTDREKKIPFFGLVSQFTLFALSLGLCFMAASAYPSHAFLSLSYLIGSGTFILLSIGLPEMMQELMADAQRVCPATPPNSETYAQWDRHPALRAYVHQCLSSPLPFLMNGDVEFLGKQFLMMEEALKTLSSTWHPRPSICTPCVPVMARPTDHLHARLGAALPPAAADTP